MHALTDSQTWNAIHAHTESEVFIVKLVWPELSMQMCDLILKGDMQEMTTLRMRFSISETCLTEINAMHAWPHSQRWYAINDNTENEVLNLWDEYDQS